VPSGRTARRKFAIYFSFRRPRFTPRLSARVLLFLLSNAEVPRSAGGGAHHITAPRFAVRPGSTPGG
jgi:hypothetical protein